VTRQPAGKKAFGKARNRWRDDGRIQMWSNGVVCDSVDCICQAQDMNGLWNVVNTVMNIRIQQVAGNFFF
jgi:hypothetical protein